MNAVPHPSKATATTNNFFCKTGMVPHSPGKTSQCSRVDRHIAPQVLPDLDHF